jgi:hypothetical protein
MFGVDSGFGQVRTKVYGISENYLDVVNLDYYMPNELKGGAPKALSNG